jgi:hypothetical protein
MIVFDDFFGRRATCQHAHYDLYRHARTCHNWPSMYDGGINRHTRKYFDCHMLLLGYLVYFVYFVRVLLSTVRFSTCYGETSIDQTGFALQYIAFAEAYALISSAAFSPMLIHKSPPSSTQDVDISPTWEK